MAQTKAATSKSKSKSKSASRSSPKPSSKSKASSNSGSASKPKRRSPSKAKAAASKSNSGKAKSSSKRSSSRRPKSSQQSKPKAAVEAVEETAKDAGSTVGRVVSKAKVPLVAGGAALAGVAGGLAYGARQGHRHGLGRLSSDDVVKAARKVGDVGMQMGQIAYEVRSAREASNGNGKVRRSPVEVVLQGLTTRRERH